MSEETRARDQEGREFAFRAVVAVGLVAARLCSPRCETRAEMVRRIPTYLLDKSRLSYAFGTENEDHDFLFFSFLHRFRALQVEFGQRIICATVGESLVFFRGRIFPSQDGVEVLELVLGPGEKRVYHLDDRRESRG